MQAKSQTNTPREHDAVEAALESTVQLATDKLAKELADAQKQAEAAQARLSDVRRLAGHKEAKPSMSTPNMKVACC